MKIFIYLFTGRRGSSASHSDQVGRENASLRFIIGPLNLVVSSSAVQRIQKIVHSALDHEYESYLNFPPGGAFLQDINILTPEFDYGSYAEFEIQCLLKIINNKIC